MNWMGGARRRISNKNSGTESKQRLFFEQQRRKRLERESRQQQQQKQQQQQADADAEDSTEDSEFLLPFESPLDVHRRHKKNFSLDILQLSAAAPTTTPRSSRRKKARRRRSKDDEDEDDDDEGEEGSDEGEEADNSTRRRSAVRRSAKKSASSRKQFDPSQEFRRLAMTSGSAKKRSASKRKTPSASSRTKPRRSARARDDEENETEDGDDACDKFRRFLPDANDSFTRPDPPLSARRPRSRSAFAAERNPSSADFTMSTPRVTFADELMGPASDVTDDAGPCDIPMGTPAQSNDSDFSMAPSGGIFPRSSSFQCDPSESPRDGTFANRGDFQCGPTQGPSGDTFAENTDFQCGPTRSPSGDEFAESKGFLCDSSDRFGRSDANHSAQQARRRDGCQADDDFGFDEREQDAGCDDDGDANGDEDGEEDVEMCTQRDDDAFPEPHTPMIRGFPLGTPQTDRGTSNAAIGQKVRFSEDSGLSGAEKSHASPRTPMWSPSGENPCESPRDDDFRFEPQPTPNIDMQIDPQTPMEERSMFASSSWASSLAPEKTTQTKRRFCQSSKKVKPPTSAHGPMRSSSLRLPNTFPKLQNSVPRTTSTATDTQDAHPKRLKFSAGFPTPVCDGTDMPLAESRNANTRAPKSSSKKRPVQTRLSSSAMRPKKKLTTPAWLEAMLKTTKSASELSNSMKGGGGSSSSEMFSPFISAGKNQDSQRTGEPNDLLSENANKCEKSDSLVRQPLLSDTEAEGSSPQPKSPKDAVGDSASDEDSSDNDDDEEDAAVMEDATDDFEAPGTPFQTVPRTPVPGIDLHPAASPQGQLDGGFFKRVNNSQPANTGMGSGLDDDASSSRDLATRGRKTTTPVSVKPQLSTSVPRRRSFSALQERNVQPPSPAVNCASSDAILSQSSFKRVRKDMPLFPKLASALNEPGSSRAEDSSAEGKVDSSKKEMAVSAPSPRKDSPDSTKNLQSAESRGGRDSSDRRNKDREFADIMRKLRAHEDREEELMSRNAELEASVVKMEKERTQPVDNSGGNKSPAPTRIAQPSEDPIASPACENAADASISTVRKPGDVPTFQTGPKQEQLRAQLPALRSSQTTDVKPSLEPVEKVVPDKQETHNLMQTTPEDKHESGMLASRISRLEKGYELLIGRNIQLQSENSELLAKVHKLEAAAQLAAQQQAAESAARNSNSSALALPRGFMNNAALGGPHPSATDRSHRFTPSSGPSYAQQQQGFGAPFQAGAQGPAQPMVINITTSHLAMNTLVPDHSEQKQPTASGTFEDEPVQSAPAQHRPPRSPNHKRAPSMLSLSPLSSPPPKKTTSDRSHGARVDDLSLNANGSSRKSAASQEDRVLENDIERILRKVRADHEKANAKSGRLKAQTVSNKENRNRETNNMQVTNQRSSTKLQDTDVEDIVRRVLAKESPAITTPGIRAGSLLSSVLRDSSNTSTFGTARLQQSQKSAEACHPCKDSTNGDTMHSDTKKLLLCEAAPKQVNQSHSDTPSSDLQIVRHTATARDTNTRDKLSMTNMLPQNITSRHVQALSQPSGSSFRGRISQRDIDAPVSRTKTEEKLADTKALSQKAPAQLGARGSNFRVAHRATFGTARRSTFDLSPLKPRKLRALPAPASQDPECPSRSRFPALKWTSDDDAAATATTVPETVPKNDKSTKYIAPSGNLLVVRRP